MSEPKPITEQHRQTLIRGQRRRTNVIDTAVAFVLETWSEMQELKGTESASMPVEYMNLHHAVCEYKGWKPLGNHPHYEEPKKK